MQTDVPATIMLSRTISKLSKTLAVFITTATTVFYFLYAPSPAWLSGNVDRAAQLSQPPARRELLSDSIADIDLKIAEKSASNLHNSLATPNLKMKEAEPEDGANHTPSTSAHAQKQKEQCTPVGGHSSTVRVLGRQLERCRPKWRPAEAEALAANFSLDDIYITIKTTQKNHKTRMLPILLTWLQTVQPEQVQYYMYAPN